MLLALLLIIILSVVLNQDIAVNGFKPAFKTKYFLFGFLMIAPLSWYFQNHLTDKKISYLLYAFCIATTIASVTGMIAMVTEYNFILMRRAYPYRNSGLFGMLMNYAHNMVFFEIIVLGLVIYRKKIEKYINLNFLYFVFIVNLLGFYATFTRGAWLGFLAAVPFYFFKKSTKTFLKISVLLCFLGAGLYVLAGKSIVRPESDSQRISHWKAAVKAFQERPILGYGYLNFETHSGELKKRYGINDQAFTGHAHNNFFEILATTGTVGIITYILWLSFWFMEMKKRDDIVGDIGLPFIMAFIVGGLTQSTISLGINLFFIMAVYALTQTKRDLVR